MLIKTKNTDSPKQVDKKLKKPKAGKLFDAKKFNGILKISKDPVEMQKVMRSD